MSKSVAIVTGASQAGVRALCHNRTIAQTDRMEIVRGSIAGRVFQQN